MLVAEPEASFELAVDEMPSEWIARTSAVTLHVEKDPFALWASDAQGQEIWRQRRSDLFTADIFDVDGGSGTSVGQSRSESAMGSRS